MQVRAQAQDAAGLYFSHLDPYCPNDENIRTYFKGPLLAVTLNALHGPSCDATPAHGKGEEEKKSSVGDWRDYLRPVASEPPGAWNSNMQKEYDGLSRRTKARMEAFMAGCMLAVPSTLAKPLNPREEEEAHMVSIQDGLSGFGGSKIAKKDIARKKPARKEPTAGRRTSTIIQMIAADVERQQMPQIAQADLVVRLDLYIRTLHRVRDLNEECIIAMENPKVIKVRARYITHAFVVTAGCVRSMSTTLTRLLNCLTMEVLAVESLSEEIVKVIRRIVLEYEHGTSFASLAFLSTPEGNAESLLTPLVLKYIRYLQANFEYIIQACELERMMSKALDPSLRHLFKTIEFKSIGHLLEVCHEQKSKLQNIELAPNVCATAENVNLLCDDAGALRQALRDLQREVITVNGHVLPPVTSRKDLLQLLTQTMNSGSLTAAPPKTKRSNGRKLQRRIAKKKAKHPPLSDESDYIISSSEVDSSVELSADDLPKEIKEHEKKTRRRSRFHLSTIDLLTRRLLIAASRTGNGGDAYFVVRDLFGGEDVEVVPTNTLPMQGRMVRPGTIDILVRLASVTIKCHQSFDVYPKAMVGECEPLIQFHTTTTETIYLQEVRSTDSNEERLQAEELSDGSDSRSKRLVVVQEKKMDKTGWRTISIQPALYEKVEVWNTPS